MGYMCHHAIIVSGSYGDHIDRAHKFVTDLAARYNADGSNVPAAIVTALPTMPAVNGLRSFAILPDGSKEGWEESNACDRFRADVVAYLRGQRYEDGSCPLGWCLVQFGDDDGDDYLITSDRLDRHGTNAGKTSAGRLGR